ncbi:MAG: hypothetical protein AAF732_24165, partial [Pseudomonadota bacterium]
ERVTPGLVPGVHVSTNANGREARQRHCVHVQSTFEPAAPWIPVTRTGMTSVGVADDVLPQAATAARRIAPRPPQRGCSRVGHFKCRDGEHAISMGPERSEE